MRKKPLPSFFSIYIQIIFIHSFLVYSKHAFYLSFDISLYLLLIACKFFALAMHLLCPTESPVLSMPQFICVRHVLALSVAHLLLRDFRYPCGHVANCLSRNSCSILSLSQKLMIVVCMLLHVLCAATVAAAAAASANVRTSVGCSKCNASVATYYFVTYLHMYIYVLVFICVKASVRK